MNRPNAEFFYLSLLYRTNQIDFSGIQEWNNEQLLKDNCSEIVLDISFMEDEKEFQHYINSFQINKLELTNYKKSKISLTILNKLLVETYEPTIDYFSHSHALAVYINSEYFDYLLDDCKSKIKHQKDFFYDLKELINVYLSLEDFVFDIGCDFSHIKANFDLVKNNPSVNFVKESNWYNVKTPIGNLSLQEWNGKLHCVAYNVEVETESKIEKIMNYLYNKYKKNFQWAERLDNGYFIAYEASDNSVLCTYAYSIGITISFTSDEIRKEETKIRLPNL
ncbi:hypothetical protein [Acinetobacter boissieri]|uniref:Uncharacterized protein n=1 Tax=Acinetobacter boissieri TaxID=1219383 RepID=A0A1G6KFD2_9GAMM|nr:hypothetical protein [Acinetobacter boissieri]SDC29531.1 hypothetical protein SAMN05421733_11715 [Acinetobacter boissieri]